MSAARGPAAHGPEIAILNPSRFPEGAARPLRAWLRELLSAVAPGYDSFTVRLVGDRTMRALNRTYRGKDKSTDVLSFPGEDSAEGRHLGDVAVAVPTARRQAAERGYGAVIELRALLLHGVLHCLGYDHETDNGTMERRERRLRRQWVPELAPSGRGGERSDA
jgi:probable rRNA maturation factor